MRDDMSGPAEPRPSLRSIARAILGHDVGCQSNDCVWGSTGGMGTNGGCFCANKLTDLPLLRVEMRKMALVAKEMIRRATETTK